MVVVVVVGEHGVQVDKEAAGYTGHSHLEKVALVNSQPKYKLLNKFGTDLEKVALVNSQPKYKLMLEEGLGQSFIGVR